MGDLRFTRPASSEKKSDWGGVKEVYDLSERLAIMYDQISVPRDWIYDPAQSGRFCRGLSWICCLFTPSTSRKAVAGFCLFFFFFLFEQTMQLPLLSNLGCEEVRNRIPADLVPTSIDAGMIAPFPPSCLSRNLTGRFEKKKMRPCSSDAEIDPFQGFLGYASRGILHNQSLLEWGKTPGVVALQLGWSLNPRGSRGRGVGITK